MIVESAEGLLRGFGRISGRGVGTGPVGVDPSQDPCDAAGFFAGEDGLEYATCPPVGLVGMVGDLTPGVIAGFGEGGDFSVGGCEVDGFLE